MLQHLARCLPGSTSLRVSLHRLRGVQIGQDVFIGTDVILETALPGSIVIGNRVNISARSTVIAHFEGDVSQRSDVKNGPIEIENDVFIGPGVIILPNVRIGSGAVVAAGSVVTRSVQPHTFVQGNPARCIAQCTTPLNRHTSTWEFLKNIDRTTMERQMN